MRWKWHWTHFWTITGVGGIGFLCLSLVSWQILIPLTMISFWSEENWGQAIWCCSGSPPFSRINSSQWWLGRGVRCHTVLCGMLQGSVLFPLLFIIYKTMLDKLITIGWDIVPHFNSWQIKQCCGHLILVSGGCKGLDEEQQVQLNPEKA